MDIQTGLQTYSGPEPDWGRDPPSDDELKHEIAPNYLFDFDVNEVDRIDRLRRDIRAAELNANTVERWTDIVQSHINTQGNDKISSKIDVFNMGAATNCDNLGTAFCQVNSEDCYAVRSEKNFPKPKDYRQRQAVIWAHIDAVTFAKAYRRIFERKRTETIALRFNESGDFESRHDIHRVNEIATRLDDIISVYTYSASSWLPWQGNADAFALNQSNDRREFGDRRFEVVDDVDEIPDGGIRCPHDQSDGEIKCGDPCRLCIDDDAPDIYVKNFY